MSGTDVLIVYDDSSDHDTTLNNDNDHQLLKNGDKDDDGFIVTSLVNIFYLTYPMSYKCTQIIHGLN